MKPMHQAGGLRLRAIAPRKGTKRRRVRLFARVKSNIETRVKSILTKASAESTLAIGD
jgi:hypothetical protein